MYPETFKAKKLVPPPANATETKQNNFLDMICLLSRFKTLLEYPGADKITPYRVTFV